MNPLKLKELNDLDKNGEEIAIQHQKIIKGKKFLNKVYIDFYKKFKEESKNVPEGLRLEIGSGGDFIKEILPNTITSDIVDIPNVTLTFSAEKLPFQDNSLSCIYLLGTLHHIENCNNFFKEVERCLIKSGRLIMIEPSHSVFSKFFHGKIHHEEFNDEVKDWILKGKDRLTSGNTALSWVIFVRDIKLFNKKFPKLKLKKIETHSPFTYILSGGVSLKCLLPSWSYGLFRFIDSYFFPKSLGLFSTIVIEKEVL